METLTQIEKINVFSLCENINSISKDGETVFCWFKQTDVLLENCKSAIVSGRCSTEHRKRASLEW